MKVQAMYKIFFSIILFSSVTITEMNAGICLSVDRNRAYKPPHITSTPTKLMQNAVIHSNEKMVNLLMGNGADLHSVNEKKMNLLHMAAMGDSIQMITFLLQHNLDLNARDELGRTALIIAASRMSGALIRTINLFVEMGADVNIETNDHRTALSWVTRNGLIDAAYMLLANNASVDAVIASEYDAINTIITACRQFDTFETSRVTSLESVIELWKNNNIVLNSDMARVLLYRHYKKLCSRLSNDTRADLLSHAPQFGMTNRLNKFLKTLN